MSDSYFKHYEGNEPFIFISYAHADDKEVMSVITDMHSRGFRLWYDEGIEAGEEWQESIASHLADSDLVICFISNAYTASENCRKELSYALAKKKKIISVFLEDTKLSPGLELQLGNIFALMKYTYPSEEYFYNKLYETELLNEQDYGCVSRTVNIPKKQEKQASRYKRHKKKDQRRAEKKEKAVNEPRKKKKWIAPLIVFIIIIGILIAALIVGYFTGYLERIQTPTVKVETLSDDTVAVFSNSIVEEAAREYTGIESGNITVSDLTGLTSLYFIGDTYYFEQPLDEDVDDISSEAVAILLNGGESIQINRGTISDFSDFCYFPSLSSLSVEFQNIYSLESLPACRIQQLNISGNKVKSLNGICNLSQLRSLTASGCPISDIITLNQCLNLRDVSLVNSNVTDLSQLKPLLKLTTVKISNCTISELSPVLRNSHVKELYLYDCDLRGSFFKSFDREKSLRNLFFDNCYFDSFNGLDRFTNLENLSFVSCEGIDDVSQLGDVSGLSAEINIS